MTFRPGMKRLGVSLFFCVCLMGSAFAEMVEVAPGVKVTKKNFPAQPNEQPFYGFIEFTPQQRDANEKFVKDVLVITKGDRQKAVEEIVRRGWSLFKEGKIGEATRRFNQAFLVEPRQSRIYHSLAAVVDERFKDKAYAEELFKIAQTLPNPLKSLNADHGLQLINMGRLQEALPRLEQAIIDWPESGTAWANLGYVRFRNGDPEGACKALNTAKQLELPKPFPAQIKTLEIRARCEGAL